MLINIFKGSIELQIDILLASYIVVRLRGLKYMLVRKTARRPKASDPSQENRWTCWKYPQESMATTKTVWSRTASFGLDSRWQREITEIPFTSNSGMQVQTGGFQPFDYFSLFDNEDLRNYLVTAWDKSFHWKIHLWWQYIKEDLCKGLASNLSTWNKTVPWTAVCNRK